MIGLRGELLLGRVVALRGSVVAEVREALAALGAPVGGAARVLVYDAKGAFDLEWARYGVTTSVIVPGREASAEQIGELACFLASQAGYYFSGCRFDLR